MKKPTIFSLVFLLSVPLVRADLMSTLRNVWQKILATGQLNFIGVTSGTVVVGFTRLLIWLLLFTIFFAVITTFGKGKNNVLGFLSKNQALIVSLIVATIGAVFMPAQIILATGAGWAMLISFLLVGGPLLGLAYLFVTWPGKGKETKGTVLLKFAACMILLWVLSVMRYHIARF